MLIKNKNICPQILHTTICIIYAANRLFIKSFVSLKFLFYLLNYGFNKTHKQYTRPLATSKTENKMKKKIKFFIRSYIIILFLGIISCEDDCEPFPNKFKISSLNSEILQIEVLNEKHQIKLSEIENNSVSYEKYSIRITAEIETYFAYEESKMKNIFIENSYACSPAPPKTDEKITNIEIYTNNDYNSMNQSGQNINQLFDVLVLNHFSSFPYYENFDLIEYINTNPNIANELIFVLKEAPENNDNFIFEIKYYQNGIDLNEYSFVTNEIEIRKE